MGSVQQVTMGAVCLGAAFAFGSYINQRPHEKLPSESTNPSDFSGQAVTSLIQDDVLIEKRPAQTPWMKPKLTSRLPMPSLPLESQQLGRLESRIDDLQFTDRSLVSPGQHDNFGGDIPPPSDLTGRRSAINTGSTTNPTAVIMDAPDFSGSTKGTASMPVIATPTPLSRLNLVNRATDIASDTIDSHVEETIESAPVFTKPSRQFVGPPTPPTGNDTLFGKPAPQNPMTPLNSEQSPRSVLQPPDNLSPLASRDQDLIATASPVRIGDPGGAFAGPRFDHQPPSIDRPETAAETSVTASTFISPPQPTGFQTPTASSLSSTETRFRQPAATQPFRLSSQAKTPMGRLSDQAVDTIRIATDRFHEHVVQDGESLQGIASQHFGSPNFYLDIYMANRDQLRFPNDLRKGMVIKVPVYQ